MLKKNRHLQALLQTYVANDLKISLCEFILSNLLLPIKCCGPGNLYTGVNQCTNP